GTLSGTVEKDVLDFAKTHKIKVMPLVTNGGFSRVASKAFLGDSKREDIAIQGMLAEARDRGYWGWQFDFEQMDASDRDLYTAFIQKAYAAFKTQNLMLSVAVIAQVSENKNDYKEGLWDSVIGVYDYRALSASADFLSIMSYDDPDSKGAVAPFPWYERVFTWSLATIPNNKISFGIPLYYWQWNDMTGKLVGIGGNEGIDNVFKNHKVTVTYDPVVKAPALHYTKDGTPYTLWYENAKSITEKLSLVKQNHLYGISAWALGLEVPSVHTVVKQ
ncbi:MAG: glycosyl hydrolase family 18 protein, partial [Minisyncoccia bacterium]